MLLFAQSATSNLRTARQVIDEAFALDTSAETILSMLEGAAHISPGNERKLLFTTLASYEERLSLLDAAGKHYQEAAFAIPSERDDVLLLNAARCYMTSGDAVTADGLIRAVLLSGFDQTVLMQARLYAAWLQLSTGEHDSAVTLIRTYAGNPGFTLYAPALLFTLWWVDGDSAAAKTLTEKYPGSPEAAIVRGEASLQAGPFWYLMDRRSARVLAATVAPAAVSPSGGNTAVGTSAGTAAATAPASATANPTAETIGVSANNTAPASRASWQQLGFFRNRAYADELSTKLRAKGFTPVIREEPRASGTVYYAVLVAETADGTIGPRLKDAGFESFPLFE